ncbi:hypothetical protein PAXRUDRAFT_10377 [Paxillus rubicundulus Ve08.2h10]|uniref:Unplaced genomic scaffold scaffold_129, whole genome shotgun sequence n=1 Tax=Paxillus rubicundulus Ve08.2h10 TaxID=930991 RepID=A0A0D0DTF4_9AGAM|nr:hypothetical protein PAXRUDRAFT_10377 [Paxillus rubicundulus Ve08.2h10]
MTCMRGRAQKEAEEEMRWKAEEVKQKVEEEAKARTEEVAWAQSLVAEQVGGLAPCYGCLGAGVAWKMKAAGGSKARCKQPGDTQPTWWRKWDEVMSTWAGKKKAWMQSLVADKEQDKEEEHDEEV